MAQQQVPEAGTTTLAPILDIINDNFDELYAEMNAQKATDTAGAGVINLGAARTFKRVIGANQSYELQNVEVNLFFTIVAAAGSGSFGSPFFTHATKTVAIDPDGQSWWPGQSNGGGGTVPAYDNSNPCEASFKITDITATHIYVRMNLTNKPTV